MNYTELKANIQNFVEDDSTELTNSIDAIISQAEEMIFQRLPSLPCFRQSTTGTLSIGTADYTVANARMIRQVSITSGTVITLAPTPSATLSYQVDFAAPETGLSDSNANSWIGNNAENVLLKAALYETSTFLKASETVSLYKGQFDEAIQLFQQEMGRNYSAEYNGGI